jgi:sugar fermentation stimulation protein A
MRFDQQLLPATLIRRYKRFLADVELADGGRLTVHCPNSGSMLGCSTPGSPVLLSRAVNPRRKYGHTLEMVQVGAIWVGVDTALTNRLVREAVELGMIEELGGVDKIIPEVRTSTHTRLDFLLRRGEQRIYLEVKNCSLAEAGVAMFPDAVTKRGTRHLHELAALRDRGHGAAVLFCVQRADTDHFAPATHIDPEYSAALRAVHRQGVLVLAYQAAVRPGGIDIVRALPCIL